MLMLQRTESRVRGARQALTPSQVIAVLEVRNLTGSAAFAGAQLSQVIQADLNPLPAAAVLREAALSQSRVRLDAAGCGTRAHVD